MRHEILDREAHFAGGGINAVDLDAGAPFAAGGAARQGKGRQDRAGLGIREADFGRNKTVRAIDHEVAIAPGDLATRAVAQHRNKFDALARPVDAAIGIDIGIDRSRRAAATDFLFGKVNRCARKIERGQFAIGGRGQHEPGSHVALPVHQRRIKRDPALLVRFGFSQDSVVGRQQLDSCTPDDLAILQ